MWKNSAERGRPQMRIRRLRIACWIPRATSTHSEYVILLLFHCKNGCSNPDLLLRYTYAACLVIHKNVKEYFCLNIEGYNKVTSI